LNRQSHGFWGFPCVGVRRRAATDTARLGPYSPKTI